MSGITLKPIDGGETIAVPSDSQTVIGRGNFLQVLDKRVSRNHGMLEIVDGTLFLTPTHANPCFYQKKGTKDKLALLKDQQKRLEAGDMFGLLPDKFFYEVTYGTVQNGKIEQKELSDKEGKDSKKDVNKETDKDTVKKEGKASEKEMKKEAAEDKKKENKANDTKNTENTKDETDSAATKEKSDKTGKQEEKTTKDEESSGKEASDTPTQKKRKLPEWLVNATSTPATESSLGRKEKPQKTPSRRGGGRGRPPKRNKPKYVESDDDIAEEVKPVKRRRRATRAVDPDEAGSSESSPPIRRPSRAAAAKRNSYVDDFVIGDEYSDDDLRYRRRTYKEDDDDDENDEDFVAWDDDDSGSDWEKNKGAKRGPGKARGSSKKLSFKPKSVGRKRRKRRNCDDDSEEELDSYIPRPSRRRAAARAQKVEKEEEEVEEEEEEEEEKEKEEKEKEEKEKEVKEEKEKEVTSKTSNTEKKQRVPCKYGEKCYRKNPSHVKEFSHPVDDDAKGAEKDDSQTGGEKEEAKEKRAPEKEKPECQYGVGCYRKNSQHRKEYKHTIQPEPVIRPKRMTTTLKVTGVDEDFSDPPPSDEESMDEDSEWEPEAESVGSSKLKASSKK